MADFETVHDALDHTGLTGVGGGGTAELLAVTAYAPGTDTSIGTTTSNTIGDVDATNLSVPFTVPASGEVLIKLSAMCEKTGSSGVIRWGLRESTSTIAEALIGQIAATPQQLRADATFYVTGLTPSASLTYKWAFRVSAGQTWVSGGPTFGKAIMEVWSAP